MITLGGRAGPSLAVVPALATRDQGPWPVTDMETKIREHGALISLTRRVVPSSAGRGWPPGPARRLDTRS